MTLSLTEEEKSNPKDKETVIVHEVFEKQRLFRPVVFDWTKKDLVVFTNTLDGNLSSLDVTDDKPSLKIFGRLPEYVIRPPKLTFTSNAAALWDASRQVPMVYVFGCIEYPYAYRYNAKAYEWTDLNPEDETGLDIATTNKISQEARTCQFVHKYILVTSKENGLLIYDTSKNKFVVRTYRLSDYTNYKDEKKYGSFPPFDMEYFCKTSEKSKDEEEFMAICNPYIVFINIKVKDNGSTFIIHTSFFSNTVTYRGRNILIYDYGCYFWKKDRVLFVCGGACTALDEAFKHIELLDVDTGFHRISSVVLPVPLCACGVTYMEETDSLYFVGGTDGKGNSSQTTFWIKMEKFRKDIEKLKNPHGKDLDIVKKNQDVDKKLMN